MDDTTRERARVLASKARRDLEFVKAHPDYTCDVCGPGGQHTVHACAGAAVGAISAYLEFHERRPPESMNGLLWIVGLAISTLPAALPPERLLQRLELLAGSDTNTILACLDVATVVTQFTRPSAPAHANVSRETLDETVRLTEQFVTFVESALPADIRPLPSHLKPRPS